jgi:hypothetical protein
MHKSGIIGVKTVSFQYVYQPNKQQCICTLVSSYDRAKILFLVNVLFIKQHLIYVIHLSRDKTMV